MPHTHLWAFGRPMCGPSPAVAWDCGCRRRVPNCLPRRPLSAEQHEFACGGRPRVGFSRLHPLAGTPLDARSGPAAGAGDLGQGRAMAARLCLTAAAAAVGAASVWVLGYPDRSSPGRGVGDATWGDPVLWKTFRELASICCTPDLWSCWGIVGQEYTPTIDGWFDCISLEIDPALGSGAGVSPHGRRGSRTRGLMAGDLVPLHTGKGADFLLALRAYKDYPGMYVMVDIKRRTGPCCRRSRVLGRACCSPARSPTS